MSAGLDGLWSSVATNSFNTFLCFSCCFLTVSLFLSSTSLFPLSIPGFPLDKAVAYSKLRNPFLINDLAMQYYIQDRYSFLLTGGMGGPEIMPVIENPLWEGQSQTNMSNCCTKPS